MGGHRESTRPDNERPDNERPDNEREVQEGYRPSCKQKTTCSETSRFLTRVLIAQLASACSMASVSRGAFGATSGAKRPTTSPFLPIRNFSKFHSTPGLGLGVMP